MSIEIVLIPLALAAVSAYQAKKSADEAGQQTVAVGTRMKNEHLLQEALADSGASVRASSGELVADWGAVEGRFVKDASGIWAVHFSGSTTSEEAMALVKSVDTAYGRRVQQEVLARLRQRAPEVGMSVESETVEDDQSVTLTLNVLA